MKKVISKICLTILWILSILVIIAMAFYGVPQLNDAVTLGGTNAIGGIVTKLENLVGGWNLPTMLSTQHWILVFMGAVLLVLFLLTLWPAIGGFKKKEETQEFADYEIQEGGYAQNQDYGESYQDYENYETPDADFEKSEKEKKDTFGHFFFEFITALVWVLTVVDLAWIVFALIPGLRSVFTGFNKTFAYWETEIQSAIESEAWLTHEFFNVINVIVLAVLVELSVLFGFILFKKPKKKKDAYEDAGAYEYVDEYYEEQPEEYAETQEAYANTAVTETPTEETNEVVAAEQQPVPEENTQAQETAEEETGPEKLVEEPEQKEEVIEEETLDEEAEEAPKKKHGFGHALLVILAVLFWIITIAGAAWMVVTLVPSFKDYVVGLNPMFAEWETTIKAFFEKSPFDWLSSYYYYIAVCGLILLAVLILTILFTALASKKRKSKKEEVVEETIEEYQQVEEAPAEEVAAEEVAEETAAVEEQPVEETQVADEGKVEVISFEEPNASENEPATEEETPADVEVEEQVFEEPHSTNKKKRDILHKNKMVGAVFGKIFAIILWVLAAVIVICAGLIAVPQFNAWLFDYVAMYNMRNVVLNWFEAMKLPAFAGEYSNLVWFEIFVLAIVIVILLISIWPAKAGFGTKKLKGLYDDPVEVDEGETAHPFVDANGNYGHVVIKEDVPSANEKYINGTLTDEQLDMEFDWKNYVYRTPVFRIIVAIILGLGGLFFLFGRFLSYGGFDNLQVMKDLFQPMNDFIAENITSKLFSGYMDITAFDLFNNTYTCGDVLDFVLWVLIVWVAIFVVLLIMTFFAWLFRKPGAAKRAAKARKAYLEALDNNEFTAEFVPSASLSSGSVAFDEDGNVLTDASLAGTGIIDLKTVKGNYEGNIVKDSLTSIAFREFDHDLLILGKPLFESIAEVAVATYEAPDYSRIDEYVDGQGNVYRVKEKCRASDMEPSYWFYKNAEGLVGKEPVETIELIKIDGKRPSDLEPSYWYGEEKHEEVKEEPKAKGPDVGYYGNRIKDNSIQPVEEQEIVEETETELEPSKAEEDQLADKTTSEIVTFSDDTGKECLIDRRLINAIEPNNLKPIDEEELTGGKETDRPSDLEPSYWYDKNKAVAKEPVKEEVVEQEPIACNAEEEVEDEAVEDTTEQVSEAPAEVLEEETKEKKPSKHNLAKVILSILWALALIIGICLVFYGVDVLRDAATNSGKNIVGRLCTKVENLVGGWNLPDFLTTKYWVLVFGGAIILVLLLISIWPAVIAYKKKNNPGRTKGFGHYVLGFFMSVVWILTLLDVAWMVCAFVPAVRDFFIGTTSSATTQSASFLVARRALGFGPTFAYWYQLITDAINAGGWLTSQTFLYINIGVLALLVILSIVLAIFFFRKKKDKKTEEVEEENVVKASDLEPDYWYEKNEASTNEVNEEEQPDALEERPSDYEPEHWYRLAQDEMGAGRWFEADEKPVEETGVEYDFDRRVINALNPEGLIPEDTEIRLPEVIEEPVEEEVVEEETVEEQPAEKEIRPSDYEPEHWYAINEGSEEESDKEIRPSDRKAAYWYGEDETVEEQEEVVETSAEEPAYEFEGERPSDYEPEHWYHLAQIDSDERPSDYQPDHWYGEQPEEEQEEAVETPVEEPVYEFEGERASDYEPEHWYEKNESEVQETIEEEPIYEEPEDVDEFEYGGVIYEPRPSDRNPSYWYENANEEEVIEESSENKKFELDERLMNAIEPNNLTPVEEEIEPAKDETTTIVDILGEDEEEPVYEFEGERPSDFEPEHWYHLAQIDSEERPSDYEPEHWYEEDEEEPVYEFKGERASDYEPEHWYHLAKIDSEVRPSDYEPKHWYAPYEPKQPRPAVKPMGTSFVPTGSAGGFKPSPIQPIKPVVTDEPTTQPEVEEDKPVERVELAVHEIHEAPKIKIQPVEARIVRFQLKTIKGSYQGELTPEEAFRRAVTNQTIVVNPIIQGQQGEKGSKYLENRANKEKENVRRTGYVSAVAVDPVEKDEGVATFDRPVSEFKSIREWSQAKKKFEDEQKAKAAAPKTETVAKAPIKPVEIKKAEPINAEQPKAEPVKPVAIKPLSPVKGTGFKAPSAPVKPIKPITPVDPKKKGE